MVKLDGDILLYKLNSWLGQKIVTNIHSLKIVVTIQAKMVKWVIKYEKV